MDISGQVVYLDRGFSPSVHCLQLRFSFVPAIRLIHIRLPSHDRPQSCRCSTGQSSFMVASHRSASVILASLACLSRITTSRRTAPIKQDPVPPGFLLFEVENLPSVNSNCQPAGQAESTATKNKCAVSVGMPQNSVLQQCSSTSTETAWIPVQLLMFCVFPGVSAATSQHAEWWVVISSLNCINSYHYGRSYFDTVVSCRR